MGVPMKNLLLMRLILLNFCGVAILAVAAVEGYLQMAVSGEPQFVAIMAAFFVIGLASTMRRAAKVSAGMNQLKAGFPIDVDPEKFRAKNGHIHEVCVLLVRLSLLGNLIGFVMGISGNYDVSSPEGLLDLAVHFMEHGMKPAFLTTICGVSMAVWLSLAYRTLMTATTCFLADAREAALWTEMK